LKDRLPFLLRQRGGVLVHARIEVMFHEDEKVGAPIDLGLAFKHGPHFVVSCKGDGDVLVTTGVAGEIQPPPDTTILVRDIEGLTGVTLLEVVPGNGSLVLKLSNGTATITNAADELVVRLNGRPLDERLFRRF